MTAPLADDAIDALVRELANAKCAFQTQADQDRDVMVNNSDASEHAKLLGNLAAALSSLRAERRPREPTRAMQAAGLEAMFTSDGDLSRKELFLIVRKGWRAMWDSWEATK